MMASMSSPGATTARLLVSVATLMMTTPVLAVEDIRDPDLKVIEGVYSGKT